MLPKCFGHGQRINFDTLPPCSFCTMPVQFAVMNPAQRDRESALSVATIRRAELMEEQTSMTTANDIAVRRTLEAAGVEFIDENGGGPGVRLRKPLKAKSGK